MTVDIRSGLRTGARVETISRIAVLESTSNVNTSRYETVKDERTDIEVIYMHLPKYTPRKQNVIGVRYLGSQTTFGGIIWRNELHDVRKDWPLVARQFGIPGVTGEMCVFVRLPDVYPVRHDRYRLDLLDDKNEPLRLIQFSSLIERLRPEWVKDLVESQQREHWSSNNIDEDLDDVARRLRLMDRILQPVEGRRTEARLVEGQGDEALPTGEATVLDPDAQPDVPGGSGSGAPKGNEAVARSARAELVEMRTVLQRKRPEPFHPRHCWIPRGSAELEELGLADPPLLACYKDTEKTVQLNAGHPRIRQVVRYLVDEVGPENRSDVDVHALTIAQEEIAKAACSIVIVAVARERIQPERGIKKWTSEQARNAYSSAALTAALEYMTLPNTPMMNLMLQRLRAKAPKLTAQRA